MRQHYCTSFSLAGHASMPLFCSLPMDRVCFDDYPPERRWSCRPPRRSRQDVGMPAAGKYGAPTRCPRGHPLVGSGRKLRSLSGLGDPGCLARRSSPRSATGISTLLTSCRCQLRSFRSPTPSWS